MTVLLNDSQAFLIYSKHKYFVEMYHFLIIEKYRYLSLYSRQ